MDLERMGLVSKRFTLKYLQELNIQYVKPMAKELEVLIRVWPVG
jgi:hypothetical protein